MNQTKNTNATNEKSYAYLFTHTGNDFFQAVMASGTEGKFYAWKTIREMVDDIPDVMFIIENYLKPLMNPVICKLRKHLPEFGTYREDFDAEVTICLWLGIREYDPYFGGKRTVGYDFFRYRLQTLQHKLLREAEKQKQAITDQFGEDVFSQKCDDYKEKRVDVMMTDLSYDPVDVIDAITNAQLLAKYEEYRKKYTEYYARKKTTEWAKKHDYM